MNLFGKIIEKLATFIISSRESAERKAADVKDRDEGIASAISEERSLTDALCSRPIPDEIMKVAEKFKNSKPSQKKCYYFALLINSPLTV